GDRSRQHSAPTPRGSLGRDGQRPVAGRRPGPPRSAPPGSATAKRCVTRRLLPAGKGLRGLETARGVYRPKRLRASSGITVAMGFPQGVGALLPVADGTMLLSFSKRGAHLGWYY